MHKLDKLQPTLPTDSDPRPFHYSCDFSQSHWAPDNSSAENLVEQMSGVTFLYPEEKTERLVAKDKTSSSQPYSTGHQKAQSPHSNDATNNESDEALMTAGHLQLGPNTGIPWGA